MNEKLKKESLVSYSKIEKLEDLKTVLEAIKNDAFEQTQRIAFSVDGASNEYRIALKARMDMATNLLTRLNG